MRSKVHLSYNAAETASWLHSELESTFDLVHKPLEIRDKKIILLYIKTVVDSEQLQKVIIRPFFELPSMEDVEAYLTSLPNEQEKKSKEQMLLELTKGSVVIIANDSLFLLDFKKSNTDTVLESNIEPTIQGPSYALSEDLMTNLNVIRHRYHQPSLTIETYTVGKTVNQSLALIYDRDEVNKEALDMIKKKIKKIDMDVLQASSELVRLLNDKKRSLIPIMMITSRTDRMSYNLAGGKIILLLDGDSNAIIAPAIFFDFMRAMEDGYHSFWVSRFSIILRYIGLIICLVMPGLYVAFTSYTPDVFRAELAMSVAGSRIGVPYPSYVEILFMLIVMEFLTEASIRLPKAISATATTVGGLVLGTAATEAALTSNIMIIIISAVAISTFVIPINEMSFAVRVFRYAILFFAAVAGMAGLMLGFIGFIMYLTHKTSFGQPYFKMFYKGRKEEIKGNNPS